MTAVYIYIINVNIASDGTDKFKDGGMDAASTVEIKSAAGNLQIFSIYHIGAMV